MYIALSFIWLLLGTIVNVDFNEEETPLGKYIARIKFIDKAKNLTAKIIYTLLVILPLTIISYPMIIIGTIGGSIMDYFEKNFER